MMSLMVAQPLAALCALALGALIVAWHRATAAGAPGEACPAAPRPQRQRRQRPRPQQRSRSNAAAWRRRAALCGAVAVGVQPARAALVTDRADDCQAVAVGSLEPQAAWDRDVVGFELRNVSFACDGGSRHASRVAVELGLSSGGLVRCEGDEWVCEGVRRDLARSNQDALLAQWQPWHRRTRRPTLSPTTHHDDDHHHRHHHKKDSKDSKDAGKHGGGGGSDDDKFIGVPKAQWKQVLIFFVCFLGIGACLEIFLIVCMSRSLTSILRRRERRGEALVPVVAPAEGGLDEALLQREDTRVLPLDGSRSSIFASDNIPVHAKVLVPAFLLVTAGLFLSSNMNVGATVEMLIKYELRPWLPFHKPMEPWDKLFGPFYLFQFSLVNTITEMYNAGVYILALLVLVWSGIWPYLKLLLLLVCWFIPPNWLSATTRGRMLLVFDALGKWCMIDIFLMVMMSVAFRFHIDSSTIPVAKWLLPRQLVVLDVNVTSEYGIYGFVIAAMLSLFMNHVVLAYHRTAESKQVSRLIRGELQTIRADPESLLEAHKGKPRFCCPCPQGSWFGVGSEELSRDLAFVLNKKEAIVTHTFRVRGGQQLKIGWITRVLVVVLLLVSIGLTVLGAYTESFQFTFTGLAGKAITLVQPESEVRRYSLVSIARAMDPGDDTLDPPSRFGVRFLQTVYLLFAFVMPLVQCIFLLALWLVPMRLRDQKIVFDTTEMVSSWAALDCFVVSIIAACVEIGQFALFLVGDRCDEIEKLAKEPCFGLKTTFLSGCWIVVAAATLLFISAQLVTRICERVICDRELDVLGAEEDAVEEREAPPGLLGRLLWEAGTP